MSAKFNLEGSGSGPVKVIEAVNDALKATEKNAEGAVKSTAALNREAQRIKESLDPQEKLNRKYEELQKLVDLNKLSISQATAAGIKYRQEMYAASEEGKKAQAAQVAASQAEAAAKKQAEEQTKRKAENERRSLQVILDAGRRVLQIEKDRIAAAAQAAAVEQRKQQQLSEAAQKIREQISPQEKLNRLYRELGDHVKAGRLTIDEATAAGVRYRRELMGAAEATEKATGPSVRDRIMQIAAGYLSVSAAISAGTQALREQESIRKEAAQRAIQSRAGLGSLSQLAANEGATREERAAANARLIAEARGFVEMGAVADDNEGGNLLFQLAGAGLNRSDRRFAAQVRAAGTLTNVGGAAEAYSALKRSVGASEVGSFREFMSKSLRAAGPAPGSFEQLPIAAAQSGGSAKALGLSDEFLLAATTVLGQNRGSIDEGGTLLSALLRVVEKSGVDFKGLGGVGIIEKIAAMPESKQGFGGILGDRAEAVEAFRVLRDNLGGPEGLRALLAEVEAAQGADLTGEAAGLPFLDSQLAGSIQSERTKGTLNRRRQEAHANRENLLNALRNERRTALVNQGWSEGGRSIMEGIEDLFGSDAEIRTSAMQLRQRREAGMESPFSPETTRMLEQYLAEIATNTKREPKLRNPTGREGR